MSKSSREQSRQQRVAAVQAANARRERNRRVGIIAGIVVVLALVVAAGFWYSSGSDPKQPPSASGLAVSTRDNALVIGPSSAKTKVVIYEDFLCPYCREFELASRDYLHSDAAQGKVQVEYRPFHLLPDTYSVRALNAFAAVLQGGKPAVALRYHDLLYDKQPYEAAHDKPEAAKLAAWAKQVGADGSAVQDAVTGNAPTYITAADAAATAAHVTGTPTVVVDGQKLSGSPSQMSDRLEQLIADR